MSFDRHCVCAALDLASLVEQLQQSPELASALAALIAAHKNLPVTEVKLPGEGGTKNAASPEIRLAAVLSGAPEGTRIPDLPLRSMAYHVIHGSGVTSNIIPYAE